MRRALLLALAVLALPVQALELKPFSASYTADWKQVPISGTAGRSLKALDNGRWELDFEASMLVASLKETSTFRMENTAFLPLTYRFERSGLGKSKQIELDFDWTEKQVLGNDRGEPVRKDAAGAILYAAEQATWMAGQAIQVLGGNGYINEYPTGRLLRDAKLYEIGAGTSEIRRMLIGRELFGETA